MERWDAVVIGAGIAGAAAAWSMARQGARVLVVEQEPHAAYHASGRSASVLSETVGHPAVCALAAASRPFFESPPAGFVDHPLLQELGLMWVGRAGDEAALDELAARGARVNSSVRRLTPAAAAHRLGFGFHAEAIAGGAVEEPDARTIDTAAFIQAYLRGVRTMGSRVATSSEAIRLAVLPGGWRVSAGELVAEVPVVVNAAGAWADGVAHRAGVRPVGLAALRRTVAIVPVPRERAAEVGRWPHVMDIANRFYLEPDAGGVLLSLADETPSVPCDAKPEMEDVALALDRLAEATRLPTRTVRATWAGLRTFAPDRVPVVGEDPDAPGFVWLAGQGGAGIKTAPALGALAAAIALGTPQPSLLGLDAATMSPARFR